MNVESHWKSCKELGKNSHRRPGGPYFCFSLINTLSLNISNIIITLSSQAQKTSKRKEENRSKSCLLCSGYCPFFNAGRTVFPSKKSSLILLSPTLQFPFRCPQPCTKLNSKACNEGRGNPSCILFSRHGHLHSAPFLAPTVSSFILPKGKHGQRR